MLRWLPICFLCFALAPVRAAEPKSLTDNWSPRVHMVLAQCMIAEADEAKQDHIAIAYAARNRLKKRQRKLPMFRYVDVLRSYCTVHKPKRQTKRTAWIRQLSFGQIIDGVRVVEKPEAFNKRSSWKRKHAKWLQILETAHDWQHGKYKDPCKGKADHWGAPTDKKSRWYLATDDPAVTGRRLVRLACSDSLVNDYYRAMTKAEKRRFDAQKLASKETN